MKNSKKNSEFTERSTRTDERFTEDALDVLLVKIIENLSKAINFEFNKGSDTAELFSMPVLDNLDYLEKSQLARDLSELLFNCRHFRDSINFRDSIESLRHFKGVLACEDRDLVEKLKLCKDIHLDTREAGDLLRLIFESYTESKSWQSQEEMNKLITNCT